ncbi:MAG: immunoglobulin domain-containing protein, partial [Phycisphaerae bacterium]|nr:immunoglobulin domain-containing protein [Phycisphaerae bacterium]
MKLVRVIFAVFLVPVAVSAAFEQEGKPRWLAVTDSEPWAPTRISLVRSSDVCQEIVLSLPGVFVSAISATDGNQYAQLSVPGCGATADEVGLPEMPFKGFFLEIPYGVEVSIEILDQTTVRLGTGFKVHPLQPALPESGSKEPPAFQINEEAYATDAFFPANPVVIDDPGFLRGRRVVFVQVFPLRYNPATTELQAFASLRFKLAFSGDADRAGEARKQRLATLQWEALAERLILNYEPVIPSTGGFVRRLSTGDAADYLVIVKDNLYEEVLPLAEWKHKKGYITRVVRMSAVGSTADDVKSYIQDAYDTWTPAPSYVLLVGDSGDVPPDYYSDREYSCTTDHPFSCVDNSNPPFAPDYLPDLMLGRLPVHTETECTNVVNKILAYERTPDMGNWYDDVLIAAYFQDSDDNGVEDKWYMETCMTVYAFLVSELGWDGHTALCTTHWNPPHHETYRFRQDNYNEHRVELNQIRWGVSPYPNPVPDWIVNLWTTETQATADISSAVNWGVGNVLHRNHGSPTAWSHPHFDTGDISALNNGSRTPVVFSINCHTGSFHREGGDCFCEAFLKKSPGGCVGIVGATQSSPTKLNELLAHGIYTCFWPAEYDPDHTTIPQYPYSWCPAEALTYGKYYVFTYAGSEGATPAYFHMYHWFGDPEMKLRTATPQTLSVSHPSSVPHGQTVNITVTVTRSGSPVQDALVAISHPSAADHWSGLTNASGSITFSGIELTQTDDYDVVASAHNCIPYEGKINLCAAPSITTHPTSKTVCEGNSVTFSVGIGGSGSLSYQWRRNGSNISGATGSSYSINPVSTGHAGSYDVVVSNDCGQVFSNSATLTVQTGPTITSQPSSRTVCEGDSV